MQYLNRETEKSNLPFRTWEGQMVVAVACGGWRRVRPLDLALMPAAKRQLVLVRDLED